MSERTMTAGRATGEWLLAAFMMMVMAILVCAAFCTPAYAEGTTDLVAGGGYRPYTERYNATTLGQQRMSVMHVYLEKGETACFGTSVADARLYDSNGGTNSHWLFSNDSMSTSYTDAQLAYVNTADVYVTQGDYANIAEAIAKGMTPGKPGVTLIDLPSGATSATPGYIYDRAQEKGGVDLSGTSTGYKVSTDDTISTSTSGFVPDVKTDANAFIAPESGIYTVVFFSKAHTGENPVKCQVDDARPFAQTQKGGTIASWDISVFDAANSLQTGRVFTRTLFLNVGGNVLSSGVSKGSVYSDVYAVTDDGYRYRVDFNGMDPYGFVFFANNRGLLKVDDAAGTSSSLYHGVRSDDNTLSDMAAHGINLNSVPYSQTLDRTYDLFYETPSDAALEALGIPTDPTSGVGGISDFTFTGTGDATPNQGYVGKGGTFSFNASDDISATSYEVDLDFSKIGGGTVVLSNALVKGGSNSIAWNGRDANGNVVPAGAYQTIGTSLKLKGGEVHFPLLDVEQNPNGIKITRLNGSGTDEEKATVYFNNSAANAGSTAAPWTTVKNWQVGNETDATSGVDSSGGAMAFTNTHTRNGGKDFTLLGDGDMCALDVWAYYDRSVSLGAWSFDLVDATFTVTKAWDDAEGTPAAGRPSNVTMTLQQSTGTSWSTVTTDDTGAPMTNPVTYDVSGTDRSYTWRNLDPTMTYRVQENPLAGYSTTYGDVARTTIADSSSVAFSQTVTNRYVPATLTLTKVWNMNGATDDQGAQLTHPKSVTFSVYTGEDMTGTHIGDYTLEGTASDANWTTTITGIDPTLTYYVYETAVDGVTLADFKAEYTVTGEGKVGGSAADGFTSSITNSFNKGNYLSVRVFKIWTDGDDYAAYRPSSIFMALEKDGKRVTVDALGNPLDNPIELSAANNWQHVWSMVVAADTPVDGYSLVETDATGNPLAGYTATPENLWFGHNFGFGGFDNAYRTTSFTVDKTWEHGLQPQADWPTAASMQLQQSLDGGTTFTDYGSAVTLTADSTDAAGTAWGHTWTGLPTCTADGASISYRVVEAAIGGYVGDMGEGVTGDAGSGYSQTVTNTYASTQLTISKTWDHGAQAQTDWPEAATFQVLADGVPTGDSVILTPDDAVGDGGTWTRTVSGLPVFNGKGDRIVYTVEETDVTGYTQSGGTVSGDAQTGFTVSFSNTLQSTDIPVTKVWVHGSQAQADWPDAVTVHLLADGTEVASATLTAADADASGGWTHTFVDEPLYDTAGSAITYTVTEDAVTGYMPAITGTADTGFILTNTHDESLVPPAPTPGTPTTPDDPAQVPDTGDTAFPLILLCAGALFASALLLVRVRRRDRSS